MTEKPPKIFESKLKMYIEKLKLKCSDCFQPTLRRLANFREKDDYECYGESYVKCFWGLCELHKSNHEFIRPTSDKGYDNYFK